MDDLKLLPQRLRNILDMGKEVGKGGMKNTVVA